MLKYLIKNPYKNKDEVLYVINNINKNNLLKEYFLNENYEEFLNTCNEYLNNILKKYDEQYIFKFYDNCLLYYIYNKHEKKAIVFNDNNDMIYKGYFDIVNEYFNGYGIFYQSENEIYEGNFKNNKKNGYGFIKLQDKYKLYGIWKNNEIIKIINTKIIQS